MDEQMSQTNEATKRIREAHALIEAKYGARHRGHDASCHIAEWWRAYEADPGQPGLEESARDLLVSMVEDHEEPCRADEGKPCAACAWLNPKGEDVPKPVGVLLEAKGKVFVGDLDVTGPYQSEDASGDQFTLTLVVKGVLEQAKNDVLEHLRRGGVMRVRSEEE